MNSNKKNIILTGGYGFIGSHLAKSLINSNNFNVINIDNLSYSSNLKTLEEIDQSSYMHLNIDIGNSNEFESIFNKYKPIKVFHLAAESHVDRSIDNPDIFMKTNILGTFNILEGLKKYLNGVNASEEDKFKLIYVSTDEVYGEIEDGKSSENDNLRPNSPYSSSKASSDLIVRAWNKTYELPVVITRCTNNYGPWQFPEKLIPLVIGKILNNEMIPIYGSGNQIRDWIHVQDHVDALIAISESSKSISGEIYNILCGLLFILGIYFHYTVIIARQQYNITDADVLGNNPIYLNDKVVGRATGGDFGFRLNKSIALGMVTPELATTGQKLKIDILGKMHDAVILDESPYDPENKLLRA